MRLALANRKYQFALAAMACCHHLAATVFFPRAQFHYGLERTDYLHRWHDRPLYQDSTFADANDPAHPINEKSWRATVRALRLGKCGIGTFIDQRIRADVIPRSVLPGAETVFLAEFDSVHSGEDRLAHVLRTAELAVAAPNAFRLDGRVVMTEYGAKTFTPEDLAFYDKVRTALAEKFGPDRFYVLPYASILPKFYGTDEPVAPDILKQAEEDLMGLSNRPQGTAAYRDFAPGEADISTAIGHAACKAADIRFTLPVRQEVALEAEFAFRRSGMVTGAFSYDQLLIEEPGVGCDKALRLTDPQHLRLFCSFSGKYTDGAFRVAQVKTKKSFHKYHRFFYQICGSACCRSASVYSRGKAFLQQYAVLHQGRTQGAVRLGRHHVEPLAPVRTVVQCVNALTVQVEADLGNNLFRPFLLLLGISLLQQVGQEIQLGSIRFPADLGGIRHVEFRGIFHLSQITVHDRQDGQQTVVQFVMIQAYFIILVVLGRPGGCVPVFSAGIKGQSETAGRQQQGDGQACK